MAKRKSLEVMILLSDKTLYDGEAFSVFVPTTKGIVAVLPYHTPIIMLLKEGEIKVSTNQGLVNVASINEGVALVDDNKLTVLVSR